MVALLRWSLLILALGTLGCGGARKLTPAFDPDAKTWEERPASAKPAPAPLRALAALAAPSSPVYLPSLPDLPSAADRAAQKAKGGHADDGALRAAWKYLKDHHVPATVLTVALQHMDHGGDGSGLAMPADPGQLDVSTGGLAALLLAVVIGLLKRNQKSSSPSSKE